MALDLESFKEEPLLYSPPVLSRLRQCWSDFVWPGLGLFGESYLLFSIGTLRPLWQELYPEIDDRLLDSLSTAIVTGVIAGMLGLGYLANDIGRRKGSITTACLMTGGAIGLTLAALILSNHPTLLFRTMAVFLFIFGVGVGGEYPMAASSASESTMHVEQDGVLADIEKEAHRGRRVQLVFSMQGLGIFVHSLSLWLLLTLTGQTSAEYRPAALVAIWRVMYAGGAAMLAFVAWSRYRYLQESAVWQQEQASVASEADAPSWQAEAPSPIQGIQPSRSGLSEVSSLSAPSVAVDPNAMVQLPVEPEDSDRSIYRLLLRNYGIRLLGASLCWFLWDVTFYGNKLFQSSFLLALQGDSTTLVQFAAMATLNSAVALLGYWTAAALVDRVGRCRLQTWGFLLTGGLSVACGFLSTTWSPSSLLVLYMLSSFFGQVGPNATTFILPAEIVPTQLRTLCHGIAAASGKLGALAAAVGFGRVDNELQLFLLSGYASFAASLLTVWTLPETLGLALTEVDRKWHLIRQGRKAEYEGLANHPQFLSYYERTKIITRWQEEEAWEDE